MTHPIDEPIEDLYQDECPSYGIREAPLMAEAGGDDDEDED